MLWRLLASFPLLAASLLFPTLTANATGDWPELRQNRHLTGVQPMAGDMSDAPVEIARHDLGRHAPALTRVANGGETAAVAIVHGALQGYDDSGAVVWTCHPEGVNFEAIAACRDLNGDGSTELLMKAGRPTPPLGAALLVDASSGEVRWRYDVEPMSYAWYLEAQKLDPQNEEETIIVCMMGYPPDPENGYIALFDLAADGGAAQRWRYDFDQYTCFPSLLYPDLNGDQFREVVVQTHSRMWVFDAISGEKTQFAQWDVSPANVRSYGRVEFTDLDGDGDEDFLCLADFAQHHEVLLNNGGVLEKAWHYGWDESVTTGKVATAWPEPPYGDFDGDDTLELVVSIYNADGDGAWETRIYDVANGAIEHRLEGVIAASLVDVDGDGSSELLANRSADPLQSAFSGAVLFAERSGTVQPVWEDQRATALKGVQPSSGALSRNTGSYTVHLAGDEALVVRADGALQELTREDNTWSITPWQAPAPAGASPAPIVAPAVVGNAAPVLLAADVAGDGRNELILYADGVATALALNEGALAAVGEVKTSVLPAFGDLDGDGKQEIVTAQISATEPPRVRVTRRMGDDILWETTLPRPKRSGLAQPRLGYLRVGRFTGRDADDVYLYAGSPVVRSVVLHGATGEPVWERGEIPDTERYWAPTVNEASVCDFDGDGAEDLVFTNPDYFCVASGKTGGFLLGPAFPPEIFDQPSQGLYTLPAVLTRNNEQPLVALVAGHYFQGVMTLDAKPLWHRVPLVGEHAANHEGFLRTDDGTWLMGYGRQDGRFDCVEVSNGAIRWSLPLGATGSSVTTCDVDGDGRQEFVFGTSHGELLAVGDGGDAARVVWRVRPAGLTPIYAPIATDLDGDGKSELAVPSGDGYVRVLDSGIPPLKS